MTERLDLEAVLTKALRDRGHPHAALEAQVLVLYMAKYAGGERFSIPALYARKVERQLAVRAMQGEKSVREIAKDIGVSHESAYRVLRPAPCREGGGDDD